MKGIQNLKAPKSTPSLRKASIFVNSYNSPKCLEAIRMAEQGLEECGYEWLLGMHTFLPHQRDCFNPLKILATLSINAGFRNDVFLAIFPSHCERHLFPIDSYNFLECLEAICLAEQDTKACRKGKVVTFVHTFQPHPRDCFNLISILITSEVCAGFRKDRFAPLFPSHCEIPIIIGVEAICLAEQDTNG